MPHQPAAKSAEQTRPVPGCLVPIQSVLKVGVETNLMLKRPRHHNLAAQVAVISLTMTLSEVGFSTEQQGCSFPD